eukprot:TRINITY_DN49655_c0_g1_i1.p1 TRINITY_DN49655_c0_g1~~TRINITY_DN49655_c0_g1_i1.p1  ORF type:complete len:144 (+),score=23.07 TRINITY_DN49655_c0_g1_i1:100-531(+)
MVTGADALLGTRPNSTEQAVDVTRKQFLHHIRQAQSVLLGDEHGHSLKLALVTGVTPFCLQALECAGGYFSTSQISEIESFLKLAQDYQPQELTDPTTDCDEDFSADASQYGDHSEDFDGAEVASLGLWERVPKIFITFLRKL